MLKLKDSKLGEWFRNRAPEVLDAIGDVVPGGQMLKALGGMIDATTTDEAERAEARRWLMEMENKDRADARSREVEVVKALKRRDWMQTAVGLVGIGALLYMVWWASNGIEEREVFFHLLGVIEGVAITIYGYYFGSSSKERP